ncbi:hypothetical protein FAIPA1_450011 [Frankia sp. AiPs1]
MNNLVHGIAEEAVKELPYLLKRADTKPAPPTDAAPAAVPHTAQAESRLSRADPTRTTTSRPKATRGSQTGPDARHAVTWTPSTHAVTAR